jgi:hypothetical protein
LNNELTEALAISARRQPEVLDVEFGTEDPFSRLQGAELLVTLKLAGGLGQTKLDEVVANVTRDWTALGNLNEFIDDLKVVIAPAF